MYCFKIQLNFRRQTKLIRVVVQFDPTVMRSCLPSNTLAFWSFTRKIVLQHWHLPPCRRLDDWKNRIRAQQELHPQRHQARQLPDGHWAPLQQALSHRLWLGQEVSRQPDESSHPVQVRQLSTGECHT